jgi:hypothetical protein
LISDNVVPFAARAKAFKDQIDGAYSTADANNTAKADAAKAAGATDAAKQEATAAAATLTVLKGIKDQSDKIDIVAYNTASESIFKKHNKTKPAMYLSLGVSYFVNPTFAICVGARYQFKAKPFSAKHTGSFEVSDRAFTTTVGVKCIF